MLGIEVNFREKYTLVCCLFTPGEVIRNIHKFIVKLIFIVYYYNELYIYIIHIKLLKTTLHIAHLLLNHILNGKKIPLPNTQTI